MSLNKPKRYVVFQVAHNLFCVWDTAKDIPIEVGNAASYVCSSEGHAQQWAFDANRKDATSNWQEVAAKPEWLPVLKVLVLVGAMSQLHDYRIELVPKILARVTEALEEYEQEECERALIDETYGGSVS